MAAKKYQDVQSAWFTTAVPNLLALYSSLWAY